MKKICETCGASEIEDRLVTVYRQRGGQHFIFERVPARVCRACGARYFDWAVAEEMERLLTIPETQHQTQPIPVVAFTP